MMPHYSRRPLRVDLWLDRWLPVAERIVGWAIVGLIAAGAIAAGVWASML